MGAEVFGFVGPGMMVDHLIAKRSMRGLLIHLPKGSTVSQPAIAQGFHVPGVGGVLEEHRVMVVAVLAGLFSSSRIQVLHSVMVNSSRWCVPRVNSWVIWGDLALSCIRSSIVKVKSYETLLKGR